MNQSVEFEQRIDSLDLQLFRAIETQSKEGDRKSWLALQRAIRHSEGEYTYLEIGSYLGGSIQQHLLDPRCRKIFSIDKRPLEAPDARGCPWQYEGNSTERMLQNLRLVAPSQVSKVMCVGSDGSDIDPALIEPSPDMCFIDVEHTESAVLSDFEFCLKVCSPNAVIYFHDASFLYPALLEIEQILTKRNIPFVSLKMLGSTYAIALADCPIRYDEFVMSLSTNGTQFLYERQLLYRDREIRSLRKAQRSSKKQNRHLMRRVRHLEQQLEGMRASRTWKLMKALHHVKTRVLNLGRSLS